MSIPCLWCGKDFNRVRGNARYCSSKCAQKQWHADKKAERKANPKYKRECLFCKTEFSTNDKRKTFCSMQCRWKLFNSQRDTTKFEDRICPVCKTVFKPLQKAGTGRTYCSRECVYKSKRKLQADGTLGILDGRKWKGRWLKALQRDNFTCQICGKRKDPTEWHNRQDRLEVHHWDGDGETHTKKNHELNNLVTLCSGCHQMFHSNVSLLKIDGEFYVRGKIFKILDIRGVKVI